jgi:hypothetical protein
MTIYSQVNLRLTTLYRFLLGQLVRRDFETASPLKRKQLLVNTNYLKIIMYKNIFI